MARTINDIKKQMTDAFMADDAVREAYGFVEGDTFNGKFSSVSIESIIFYIIAACQYTFEVLFDNYGKDVEETIAKSAHTPRWYRDKALAFMADHALIEDTDIYDTSNMSDEEIEEARVVKFAAATESKYSAMLTIKVAGKTGDNLTPLDTTTKTQLSAYFAKIKDAGVRINLISQAGDLFDCVMDVYYNPLISPNIVKTNVEDAIKGYISGLPFDGQYTNMGCVDAVQRVEGVEIAELRSASVKVSSEATPTPIDARHRPVAGYMVANSLTINMRVYDEQV